MTKWDFFETQCIKFAVWAQLSFYQLKPCPDMQLVAVQLVALLGELFCLGNKLLKVEHVQHCATCRQVRIFAAQTGNLLRRQLVDDKLLILSRHAACCRQLPAKSTATCCRNKLHVWTRLYAPPTANLRPRSGAQSLESQVPRKWNE